MFCTYNRTFYEYLSRGGKENEKEIQDCSRYCSHNNHYRNLLYCIAYTMTIIACDDQILSQDDCKNYLDEKYSKSPQVIHFKEMYPGITGLSFTTINFKAVSVSATSMMNEKRFADLEINLEDFSSRHRCADFNLPDDDHITVDIANPTIEDMNNNYCLGQRE